MKLQHLALGCAVACVGSASMPGCAAYLATSPEDFKEQTREGLVYYLPRSVLNVKFTYRVYRPVDCALEELPRAGGPVKTAADPYLGADGKPVVVNSAGQRVELNDSGEVPANLTAFAVVIAPNGHAHELVALAENSLSISPESESDAGLAFRVDPEALSSFMVAVEDGKLVFSPDGMLKSVNAKFSDKSAEVVAGVFQSVLNIAKMAAGLSFGPDRAVAKPWIELAFMGERTVEYRLHLSDFHPAIGGEGVVWNSAVQPAAFGSFRGEALKPGQIQPVRIEMRAPRDLRGASRVTAGELLSTPVAKRNMTSAGGLRGLFFRIPAPTGVTVSVGPVANLKIEGLTAASVDEAADSEPGYRVIVRKQITLGEAGGFGFMPVQSRPFSTRTYGITLSETTGGLTILEFGATSQGQSMAAALSATSEKARTEITDWDTERMDQETERLKAEAALIRAKADLEKAKKGE